MSSESDLPFVGGLVAGIGAWILGYLATFLVVAPDVQDSPLQRLLEAVQNEPATHELVGWVFYNAHFVNTVFQDVPVFGSQAVTYVGGENGFSPLLYLVPIGLLLAAGLALGRSRGVTDPRDGILAGLTVIPGYLVLSIAGAFLFEVTLAGASGGPDLLPAVVLAGILYPAVFGGAGGVIAAVTE